MLVDLHANNFALLQQLPANCRKPPFQGQKILKSGNLVPLLLISEQTHLVFKGKHVGNELVLVQGELVDGVDRIYEFILPVMLGLVGLELDKVVVVFDSPVVGAAYLFGEGLALPTHRKQLLLLQILLLKRLLDLRFLLIQSHVLDVCVDALQTPVPQAAFLLPAAVELVQRVVTLLVLLQRFSRILTLVELHALQIGLAEIGPNAGVAPSLDKCN